MSKPSSGYCLFWVALLPLWAICVIPLKFVCYPIVDDLFPRPEMKDLGAWMLATCVGWVPASVIAIAFVKAIGLTYDSKETEVLRLAGCPKCKTNASTQLVEKVRCSYGTKTVTTIQPTAVRRPGGFEPIGYIDSFVEKERDILGWVFRWKCETCGSKWETDKRD